MYYISNNKNFLLDLIREVTINKYNNILNKIKFNGQKNLNQLQFINFIKEIKKHKIKLQLNI